MWGPARLLDRTSEAVGEYDERPRRLAIGERLEHHVVAALGERRTVPRAVECDECASAVRVRKLPAAVDQEIVGRPVCRKPRNGATLVLTGPDSLAAITAVLGGKDQLLLIAIEIALRPTVIGAVLKLQQFFSGLICSLLRPIQFRPVLRELIPAMLHDIQPARLIECEPLTVADPGGEPLRRGEALPDSTGIVTPRATAGLEFGAGTVAARAGHPVSDLAGIGCRAEVHIKISLCVDHKRMHGMIATERKSGNDHLRRRGWHGRAGRQPITYDAVVHLG